MRSPLGWFVPVPSANACASSSSLASVITLASSCCIEDQSAPTSTVNGTKTASFSGLISGCVTVIVSSETSVDSGSQLAVVPTVETPRHTSVVIVVVVASCRSGFVRPSDVSITVGSRVAGTAKPPALSVSDYARSAIASPTWRTAHTSSAENSSRACSGSISFLRNADRYASSETAAR
jgi:hypothetical protein